MKHATTVEELKNGPALNVSGGNSYQIFPAIKVIWFMLHSISKNRANELRSSIISLFDKHKDNNPVYSVIENCIGYDNIF